MKKAFVILFSILMLASCKEDKPVYTFTATVTVKPTADGGFYMVQDDSTALIAKNIKKYPYPEYPEKRAIVIYNYSKEKTASVVEGYKYVYDVEVARMDSLKTKNPVRSLGTQEADAKAYGNDEIGLYLRGVFPYTIVEDGYLSVSMAFAGEGMKTHYINLVTGVNPSDPYEVELRHDAQGERKIYTYSSVMEFPLKGNLPSTGGEVKDLTLKWNSLATGQKETVRFKIKL